MMMAGGRGARERDEQRRGRLSEGLHRIDHVDSLECCCDALMLERSFLDAMELDA